MRLIDFFPKKPITTLMIYAVLALVGLICYFRMPVDLMPSGDSSVLTIFIGIRGGLPPEDIESLVTKPVEDEMATLQNLQDIVSVSRKERAVITLTFKVGTDSSRAALEVQERMAKIRGKLPKEIEKPVVSRYDENQAPVMILAMSSKKYSPEQLRDIADNELKPILKRTKGVANVEIGGGRERKILVEFDQNRLSAHKLPIRQVISQIGLDNLNILTGKLDREKESNLIRMVGVYKSIEEMGELPIAVTKEGSRLRLKDVAEIRDFYLEPESYSRLNREPVISAYIQKEALENTISTAKRIRQASDEFKKTLDPQINFSVVSDQSIAIQKALNNVRDSLLEGAFLAGIILLVFLRDFLSASIIFTSIPLSFVITLAVMNISDLSLNVMTISGLALASGMVVDDSIVVLENIVHHWTRYAKKKNAEKSDQPAPKPVAHSAVLAEEGFDPVTEDEEQRNIPVRATEEMFLALTASTLTKMIVFLPILFLNPDVRVLYSGLAITVSSALLLSLIVSVTVIPTIAANLSPKWKKESAFLSHYFWTDVERRLKRANLKLTEAYDKVKKKWKRTAQKYPKLQRFQKTDPDLIYPTKAGRPLVRFKFTMRQYRRWVAALMRKRYWLVAVLSIVLIACGYLYKRLDKEFAGTAEENEFTIFVELPSGAKLDVSDKVVAAVEKILEESPDVQKAVKTSVSRVEGWSSKIYVTLQPRAERTRSAQEVISAIRPLVAQVGQQYSAFVYFSEPISSKEFVIDVFGYDYVQLRDIAVKIAQSLEKVPGLADIKLRYKPGRPEVRIEVDREKASMFDFTIQDISETLHAQIRGLRATYFLTPTAQIETVARLQEMYRKTLEDIESLAMINRKGILVPVRQFASFEFGLTPSEVWRKNRERMIQVSANRGEMALSRVSNAALSAISAVEIPPGYYFEVGGDFPKMVETEKESRFAFVLMVVLVYAVLASLFESLLQPLIILVAVPLTLVGAIPLLFVTQTPVTLGTLIGLIMLGGISVSNSIILIDVFNSISQSKSLLRALLQAGQDRIRPIVMTTLTTILGLAPMMIGREESGSLWAPLALTVIGGLTVSTVLVLFVIPAFYLIMEDIKKWCVKKLGFRVVPLQNSPKLPKAPI